MSLCVDDQNSGSRIEFGKVLGDAHLLGALREPVLGFHLRPVAAGPSQPFHMIVDGIARGRPRGERPEIFLCKALSTLNARIDVVALLEIDVLEEVSADGFRRN